uniref:E3 ubiquitin-protein ligase MARCH7 n=1 Tax=Anthurium amnicola TaxID=1678845 RepID=A0A1D1XYP4_9ARAE
MDNSSSSRTHNSTNNNNNNVGNNTTNVNVVNVRNTVESSNKLSVTEYPQIAITRKPSLIQVLNEVPPPPYPSDSDMQIPTPSHPPEYSIINTQPQPRTMLHRSNNNRFSDVSITNEYTQNESLLFDSSQPIKFCKICQESEESQSSIARDEEEFITGHFETYEKGKLISPCKCKGSLQYVHIGCLNKWRHSNVRLEASYRCEVCKYEYKFYRPRLAKIFSSNFTLHILSLILLSFIILLTSYIVKLLINHNNVNNNPDDPNNNLPDKNKWKDIKFLNIRLIEYILGISIISFFGLMFFMFMICFNGFDYTRENFCFCGGFGTCGYGTCGGSDCSTAGDCGSIVIIFFLIIIAVMFMLGFLGAIFADYLFIQKITTLYLKRVHDRILEVKKD